MFPRVSDPKARNITWHHGDVSPADRAKLLGHESAVVWLTGLSGSGKSTVARAVENALHARRVLSYVLDGDNVRHGLCGDLGFSADDRAENIRRVGEVARLLSDTGSLVITAFISPFRADRDRVRALLPTGRFLEVHVATPLEVCEARDPKGLWKRARAGEIGEFTGLSSPYEAPQAPELIVGARGESVDASAAAIVSMLENRAILPA